MTEIYACYIYLQPWGEDLFILIFHVNIDKYLYLFMNIFEFKFQFSAAEYLYCSAIVKLAIQEAKLLTCITVRNLLFLVSVF